MLSSANKNTYHVIVDSKKIKKKNSRRQIVRGNQAWALRHISFLSISPVNFVRWIAVSEGRPWVGVIWFIFHTQWAPGSELAETKQEKICKSSPSQVRQNLSRVLF